MNGYSFCPKSHAGITPVTIFSSPREGQNSAESQTSFSARDGDGTELRGAAFAPLPDAAELKHSEKFSVGSTSLYVKQHPALASFIRNEECGTVYATARLESRVGHNSEVLYIDPRRMDVEYPLCCGSASPFEGCAEVGASRFPEPFEPAARGRVLGSARRDLTTAERSRDARPETIVIRREPNSQIYKASCKVVSAREDKARAAAADQYSRASVETRVSENVPRSKCARDGDGKGKGKGCEPSERASRVQSDGKKTGRESRGADERRRSRARASEDRLQHPACAQKAAGGCSLCNVCGGAKGAATKKSAASAKGLKSIAKSKGAQSCKGADGAAKTEGKSLGSQEARPSGKVSARTGAKVSASDASAGGEELKKRGVRKKATAPPKEEKPSRRKSAGTAESREKPAAPRAAPKSAARAQQRKANAVVASDSAPASKDAAAALDAPYGERTVSTAPSSADAYAERPPAPGLSPENTAPWPGACAANDTILDGALPVTPNAVARALLLFDRLGELDDFGDLLSCNVRNVWPSPVASHDGPLVWRLEDLAAVRYYPECNRRSNLLLLGVVGENFIKPPPRAKCFPLGADRASDSAFERVPTPVRDDKLPNRVKQMRSLLNKLNSTNRADMFELLMRQLKTYEDMTTVVNLIFNKACNQHQFIPVYADLTVHLYEKFQDSEIFAKSGTDFKHILFQEVQQKTNEDARKIFSPNDAVVDDERYEEFLKFKTKLTGNMIFIAELYLRALINRRVAMTALHTMLSERLETQIEAAVLFLRCLKKHRRDGELRDIFRSQLDEILNGSGFSQRLRCLLQIYMEDEKN